MKHEYKVMIINLLIISLLFTVGMIAMDENKKKEKIFVTIGDSITARDNQTYGNNQNPYIGYQQHIKKALKMDRYINLGISGATIARGTEYVRGLSKIVVDFNFGDVDFIIVQAGTNDFALGVPLGSKEELTKEEPNRYNFYGAYSGLIKDLKKNNKNTEIYIWTPTKRDCKKFGGVCKNNQGIYLKEYVEAIKEVGKYHGVCVMDMYALKNISTEKLDEYTIDGLHMSNDGYRILANRFIKEYKDKHR